MSDRFITNAILRRNKRRRIRRLSHLRFRLRSMVILTTVCCIILVLVDYFESNLRDEMAKLQTGWPNWQAWDVLPVPCLFLAVAISVGLCFFTFHVHPSRGWIVSLSAFIICLSVIWYYLVYEGIDVRLHRMLMRKISVEHFIFAVAVPSLVLTPLGSLAGWLAALQEHTRR